MNKVLLVIDDSPGFREVITLAGEEHGWLVLASNDLGQVSGWLQQHPDRVLLDWQLPGQQRQEYVKLLEAKNLTSRTLLVSATMDEARQRFIVKHGLAGFRLKPLDLDHFSDEIRLPENPIEPNWPGLEDIARQMDVAINILDRNLNTRWCNQKDPIYSLDSPKSTAQRLIVKWLKAEMEDTQHYAARRIDWDGNKECFLESRLFDLKQEGYWLARDWRGIGDRPHDHEILNLEQGNDLDLMAWLLAVAKLLAQRYAISRLRVYKIVQLPDIDNSLPVLAMPLFQCGGGFKPHAEAWRQTGFLASENPLIEQALRPSYEPEPVFANDQNCHNGCKPIQFGEKGTYRVLFPVHGSQGQVSALFAMDRRLDHIGSDHIVSLSGMDKEVVEIAKRMASDDADALNPAQCSLMGGLVKDLGERLNERLKHDEDQRATEWHKTITKAIRNTFAEAGRSPEMIYEGLSQVCDALVNAWKNENISGHIMGTTAWLPDNSAKPLSAWYIALLIDETHWQAVAGWGDAYRGCRHQGRHVFTQPHQTAKAAPAWQAAVVQNFQTWSQTQVHSYQQIVGEALQIGSWLAVPMQVDGSVRALMVVHSPHAYYFSKVRIGLMESAAGRLLPLLAAAQRETRARNAFAASVMHEVKNDSHAAILLLEKLQGDAAETPWAKRLEEIRFHLEGLNALGQDTLDVFQLGLDSGNGRIRQKNQENRSMGLGELIERAAAGWTMLYEDTQFNCLMPEALATIEVSSTLKRVLRALLHNAFRHGLEWVRMEVALEAQPDNPDHQWLKIKIKNLASVQVARHIAEMFNPTEGGLGSSPLIRARLGLAVAHQLATEVGGFLGNLEFPTPDTDSDEAVEIRIALFWPIFTENNP